MAYTLTCDEYGAVKHFTAQVSGQELLESERCIAGQPGFASFRYVVSDYLGVTAFATERHELVQLHALRMQMHQANPRIKYAFVTRIDEVRSNVRRSIAAGHMRYPAQVFDDLESAVLWALTDEGS